MVTVPLVDGTLQTHHYVNLPELEDYYISSAGMVSVGI